MRSRRQPGGRGHGDAQNQPGCGPRVDGVVDRLRGELESVRAGGRSELLDTLIAYEFRSLLGPFTREPAQIGASEANTEAR